MPRLIGLPEEIEKLAAAEAQKNGKSLEEYLLTLVTNAMMPAMPPMNQAFADQVARSQRSHHWSETSYDALHSRNMQEA